MKVWRRTSRQRRVKLKQQLIIFFLYWTTKNWTSRPAPLYMAVVIRSSHLPRVIVCVCVNTVSSFNVFVLFVLFKKWDTTPCLWRPLKSLWFKIKNREFPWTFNEEWITLIVIHSSLISGLWFFWTRHQHRLLYCHSEQIPLVQSEPRHRVSVRTMEIWVDQLPEQRSTERQQRSSYLL